MALSRCERRLRAGDARLRLLRVLHAAGAGCGEIGVALVLLRGEGHRGLVDIDGRLGGVDHGLLNVELRLLARDRRLRRGDIGLGLVERDLEVAVVDPGQHLAGLHMLVIADQDPIEVAGNLRRDGGVVGLHIGVIGGDQKVPDGPVILAIPGRAGQHGQRRTGQQQLAEIEFLRGRGPAPPRHVGQAGPQQGFGSGSAGTGLRRSRRRWNGGSWPAPSN